MSDSDGEGCILESRLQKLECHFTWGLRKEDADLDFLEVKLRETLDTTARARRRGAEGDEPGNVRRHSFNLLAYAKHLRGDDDPTAALERFQEAERHGDDEHDDGNPCVAAAAVVYGNLAWLRYRQGDETQSLVYVKKAEKIIHHHMTSPATTGSVVSALPREILSEKAWSFLRFSKKHYVRAKECFREAVQREPGDPEWNLGYAFSLFRLEGLETRQEKRLPYQDSPAVRQLQRALELRPDSAVTRVYLGLKCYKNRRNGEAWTHMRTALSLAPDNLSVVLQVARFMKKERHFDEALAVLRTMLSDAPNSSRLHHELANVYRWKAIRGGNPHDQTLLQRCVHHLEEGARLNPTHVYPQIELASRYAELKDARRAEDTFQELWTRPDLRAQDRQAWHRMYGDFHMYRLGSERAAVGHYMDGMRLGDISAEWRQCKARLLRVLSNGSRGRDHHHHDPYEIRAFVETTTTMTPIRETTTTMTPIRSEHS